MIEVVPAFLPEEFSDLEEKTSAVKGLVDLIQMDIVDGIFAPSKTWPYKTREDSDFKRIISEEGGLPNWKDVNYELDMMVTEPEKKIDAWIHAGISSAVLHFESSQKIAEAIEKCTMFDIKVGIALNPSTLTEEIYPFLEDIEFVQFMGNDKIGFQGQPLDSKVLKKIREFHKEYPDMQIAIDIGVTRDSAGDLIDAGVTKLVSGGAIFDSTDIEEAIDYFQNL